MTTATSLKPIALATLLTASASGQNLIFIPSLLSQSSLEPPCRQRRLEPFRQNIRDSCRSDTSHCTLSPFSIDDALAAFPADVRHLFYGFSSARDHQDRLFDDLMGQSLMMFDAMLAMDGIHNAVEVDTKEQQAEQAAEQALDVMVTSLFTNSDMDNKRDIANRLEQMGTDLLTRRRLSERSPSDGIDPHAAVQERLARRLTEYSMDLFFHPDGTVTLYTSSIPQVDQVPVLGMGSEDMDSCLYSRYNNGDLEQQCKTALDMFMTAKQTPGLMYDQFDTLAGKDRTLDQRAFDAIARTLEQNPHRIESHSPFVGDCRVFLMIVFVYLLIAFVGLCTGVADIWTFIMGIVVSISVATLGFWSLVVLLPTLLLVDRLFLWEDQDDDDGEETDDMEGYAYVKLSDEDDDDKDESGGEDVPVKQAKTLVFVGVPVQVV